MKNFFISKISIKIFKKIKKYSFNENFKIFFIKKRKKEKFQKKKIILKEKFSEIFIIENFIKIIF